jgi:hypothetical protein
LTSLESQLVEVLQAQVPEFSNTGSLHLELIQENTYRLFSQPPYFVKVIADDDRLGQNELRVNKDVLATDSIARPELVYRIKMPGATLACWEWLEGTDLRTRNRELLPQAFKLLGRFHVRQRYDGPVESPVTQCSYASVQQMLEDELATFSRRHPLPVQRSAEKAGELLSLGYATILHGDMHPGNLRFTAEGLKFVDWGYSIPSLNLFDLGYIETIAWNDPLTGSPWWTITPAEACTILPAYYAACGLTGADYRQVQLAVMYWSKLWAYENCLKYGDKPGASSVRNQLAQLAVLI